MTAASISTDAGSVIECSEVTAGYGDLAAIRDVSLSVRAGEMVALLGANGSGKTTTLRALTGELPLMHGSVTWKGQKIRPRLDKLARGGMAYVPDEGGITRGLTVRDNLDIGRCKSDDVLALFPELEKLMKRRAGLISGGEQRMLALGRALASGADLLVLDEVLIGLAPIVANRIFTTLEDEVRRRHIAVLLVEQQARRVIGTVDRFYVLRDGRIAAEGNSSSVSDSDLMIKSLYLGEVAPE